MKRIASLLLCSVLLFTACVGAAGHGHRPPASDNPRGPHRVDPESPAPSVQLAPTPSTMQVAHALAELEALGNGHLAATFLEDLGERWGCTFRGQHAWAPARLLDEMRRQQNRVAVRWVKAHGLENVGAAHVAARDEFTVRTNRGYERVAWVGTVVWRSCP